MARVPAITGSNSHLGYQQRSSFGAVFFCFGTNTPTPEFCENSHERGPRSPAGTAQGFDPPLGAQRNAAARGGDCAGVGRTRRKGGGVPRRARRGRRFAGAARARRSAGARGAGAFLPGGGGKPGAGRIGRVRRTKAAWRARRRGAGTCQAARHGRFAGLSGADAGKARRAAGAGR